MVTEIAANTNRGTQAHRLSDTQMRVADYAQNSPERGEVKGESGPIASFEAGEDGEGKSVPGCYALIGQTLF